MTNSLSWLPAQSADALQRDHVSVFAIPSKRSQPLALVQLPVLPRDLPENEQAEWDDIFLHGNAMDLLCSYPCAAKYSEAREILGAQASSTRYAVDMPRGGWVGLLDSTRKREEAAASRNETSNASIAALFLGAENGHPVGRELWPGLPVNERFGAPVRGPIVVYAFLPGSGTVFDMPESSYARLQDIVDELRPQLVARLRDDSGLV